MALSKLALEDAHEFVEPLDRVRQGSTVRLIEGTSNPTRDRGLQHEVHANIFGIEVAPFSLFGTELHVTVDDAVLVIRATREFQAE
jgi:hypothetical protein